MLEKLRQINNKLILKYKLENNNDLLLKQRVISKLLQSNDCFFKMPIETAYAILTDLGFKKDELKSIYIKLTQVKN